MKGYVDGYILVVPEKNLPAYRRLARKGGQVWRKYGALEYFECVDDDLGSKLSGIKFPRTVKAKPGERVIFSFIVFKSRAHRDRVNAKAMKDPRLAGMGEKVMPFDWRRMAYGGFKVMVER